jgi:hypothetical protein
MGKGQVMNLMASHGRIIAEAARIILFADYFLTRKAQR